VYARPRGRRRNWNT